jgi:antirestriction protein ArdC
LTAVFAQDQVQELPPPAVPAPLECPYHRELVGDDLAPVIPGLLQLADQIGSTVTFQPINGNACGYYQPETKRIVIDDQHPVNQLAATLCHELAHALVRADRQADDPSLDYASEELVAESVSFSCLRSVGIDADGSSIPYLASWAENSDVKIIEQTAGLIDRLARRIESALHNDDQAERSDDRLEVENDRRVDPQAVAALSWPGASP